MTTEQKPRRWSNQFVLTTAGASSTDISNQATGWYGDSNRHVLQEQTWDLHKSDEIMGNSRRAWGLYKGGEEANCLGFALGGTLRPSRDIFLNSCFSILQKMDAGRPDRKCKGGGDCRLLPRPPTKVGDALTLGHHH